MKDLVAETKSLLAGVDPDLHPQSEIRFDELHASATDLFLQLLQEDQVDSFQTTPEVDTILVEMRKLVRTIKNQATRLRRQSYLWHGVYVVNMRMWMRT